MLWIVVIMIVVGLLSGGSRAPLGDVRPAAPSALGDSSSCDSGELTQDFGLSRLPTVEGPPSSGDLPFGPKTVSLLSVSEAIVPAGSDYGYWLMSQNYYGRTPLHWTLRAKVRVVSKTGELGRIVDSAELTVPTITSSDEVKLYLGPIDRPGFYRFDFEISADDNSVLGSYSEYLKVFQREFWKARLGLNRRRIRPGGHLLSRVENLGTKPISYGEAFGVQRFGREGWASVPDATNGAWLAWGGEAGPGRAGRCSAFRVPRDFRPGRYRIVKEVGSYPWPRGGRSVRLAAPFRVIG